MDLEPTDLETALELYLAAKEREYAASTIGSHRSRLEFFLRWCAEYGIDTLRVVVRWPGTTGGCESTSPRRARRPHRTLVTFCSTSNAPHRLPVFERVVDDVASLEDRGVLVGHFSRRAETQRYGHTTIESP